MYILAAELLCQYLITQLYAELQSKPMPCLSGIIQKWKTTSRSNSPSRFLYRQPDVGIGYGDSSYQNFYCLEIFFSLINNQYP